MQTSLKIQVGKLMTRSEGSVEKYTIHATFQPEDGEFVTLSPVTGKVRCIKIDEGALNIDVQDMHVDLEMQCGFCLKTYAFPMNLDLIERQFYKKKPDEIDDLADIFLIESKTQEVNLSEMLRQEIILHFPDIPVCSSGCKGLCPVCGKDRNTEKCSCKTPEESMEESSHKPLSQLKKIIKL